MFIYVWLPRNWLRMGMLMGTFSELSILKNLFSIFEYNFLHGRNNKGKVSAMYSRVFLDFVLFPQYFSQALNEDHKEEEKTTY